MGWISICLIIMVLASGQSACDRASNKDPLTQTHRKSDGLFRIVENGKHGYIDKGGRIVIPPQFDDAGPFSEGLAAVTIGNKSGYINNTGKILISLQFDDACPFYEGVATVAIGEKIGYIDKSGQYIWTPKK